MFNFQKTRISGYLHYENTTSQKEAVPKVMSVAFIEPFDEWFLSLSKGSGTTRRNDCYTKCGGFDKLNHRNANLLDSPVFEEKNKWLDM